MLAVRPTTILQVLGANRLTELGFILHADDVGSPILLDVLERHHWLGGRCRHSQYDSGDPEFRSVRTEARVPVANTLGL